MNQDAILAARYAKGLLEQAEAAGEMTEVRQDLEALAGIFGNHADGSSGSEFLSFLSTPAVRVEDKVTAAEKILDGAAIRKTVRNFVALVIRHHRTALLPRMIEEFFSAASSLTGECIALVETARELTQDQESRLQSVLQNAQGGVVRIRQQVVPGLLAGARIRIGGTTIDGSVLGRLEKLRTRLVYGELADDEAGNRPADEREESVHNQG